MFSDVQNFDYFPELGPYPNFFEIEKNVSEFWLTNNVENLYLRLNENSSDQFSFFDGPITANNPMGVHHAWGRTIKDAFLRYNTLQGKKIRYQNGFDCQGLWIEVGVEKILNLNSKKEILDFGLDNFSNACKDRVKNYSSIITDQSKQLGQFMDWNNSYYTHTDKNIESIWFFLSKCFDNGWLYKGHKIMPWCPRCETSLSQHEQSDSYKDLVHPSIFVKFQVKKFNISFDNLKNEKIYFLVWTTTPWTLPANTAVAVNPEIEYVLIKSSELDYLLLVSEKSFMNLKFLKNGFSVEAKILGSDLKDILLCSPTKEFVPAQKSEIKVVCAEFVSDEDGTGIVHIAPGCGLDDFELGVKENLPILDPLHENGTFKNNFGFNGMKYSLVSKKVLENLKRLNLLYNSSKLKHRYPVCWRCGEELVFRLVDEWFIKTEEIRPKLLNVIKEINWHPSYMYDQMKNWLDNMGDWCISRKRFWGLPLPIFDCVCGHVTVIRSVEDLWRLTGFTSEGEFRKSVPDLHRPYVDNLTIECSQCHQKVNKVLEVGDCWLDAGIIPFSTLDYLNDNSVESKWNQWFPADFVVEMREQIRLWFYSLLFMSVTITGKAPYKFVMAYEKVLDDKGNAMHRSKGNAIWWSETAEKMGSDPNRWFYTGQDPSRPLLYGYNNIKKSLNSFNTFWSCCRFFHQNTLLSKSYWSKLTVPLNELVITDNLDAWLLVELKKTDELVQKYYQEYRLDLIRKKIDEFWLGVSNFWLRNNRTKFWKYNDNETKGLNVLPYQLLWHCIQTSLFWLAPIVPYSTEYLYQMLVRPLNENLPISIHLNKWLKMKISDLANFANIEQEVNEINVVLELGRNLRQLSKIKNRYEVPVMYFLSDDENKLQILKNWLELLKNELNTLNIKLEKPKDLKSCKTLNKSGYHCFLPQEYSENIKISWIQSDVIRTFQFLRKQADLKTTDITSAFVSEDFRDSILFEKIFTENMLNRLESEVLIHFIKNPEFDNNHLISRKLDIIHLSKKYSVELFINKIPIE